MALAAPAAAQPEKTSISVHTPEPLNSPIVEG